MRAFKIFLCSAIILVSISTLYAGEAVLYAGVQKPGELKFTSDIVDLPAGLLEGGRGGTYGFRFSNAGIIGIEQSLSFSPRFGSHNVHAFQMDTNLLVQAPGRVVPYATAGIGFIATWGQNYPTEPDPAQIAAYAFNLGQEFTINYGGGIKFRRCLGPMGFDFDVRGYTIPSARDGSLNLMQTSLGLVFTW
jgi:hypothetical protein